MNIKHMATKKQLAALARGRAIRKANLKKYKSSKRTKAKYKRKTKSVFNDIFAGAKNLSSGFKTFGDILGGFVAPIGAITSGFDNISKLTKAYKTLTDDERKIDTDDIKQILKAMRKNLLAIDKSYEDSPLFNKINEVYKNLIYIELLKSDGQDTDAQREIRNTLYLYSDVVNTYNNIMSKT